MGQSTDNLECLCEEIGEEPAAGNPDGSSYEERFDASPEPKNGSEYAEPELADYAGNKDKTYSTAADKKNRLSLKNREPAKKERSNKGSVAIIYHEDPETGEVEFYLEQKPADYGVPKYSGTIALIGGAKEGDEPYIETLAREIGEEIEDTEAKSILTDKLGGEAYLYDIATGQKEGKPHHTSFYVIKIGSKKDWETVSSSGLTHDAGSSRVLKLEEILCLDKKYFSSNHGEVLKRFIMEEYGSGLKHARGFISGQISSLI